MLKQKNILELRNNNKNIYYINKNMFNNSDITFKGKGDVKGIFFKNIIRINIKGIKNRRINKDSYK